MRCPSLTELPPPPAGKTGWPWTEETPRAADAMPDGRPWPRITVVTPSYNQAQFLEETIRSVLLQGYPDLEYLVMDGGSDDGSVKIIEKYSPWLAYWTSEPDRGQSDAINKGLRRATGELMAWLNSDDVYYAGSLRTVAFATAEPGWDIYLGAMDKVEVHPDHTRLVKRSLPTEGLPIHPFPILANGRQHMFHFYQPAMFWTRRLWERTGGLDERYHFVMDLEWCNRALACGAEVRITKDVLTRFAVHPQSKSEALHHRQMAEYVAMCWRLSRTREFRRIPCFLSALRPAQRTLSLLSRRAEQRRQRARAVAYRTAARALKAARLYVPGLSGAERVEDHE